MSFPCYPKYRTTRTEWLGDVPVHWEEGKFRHFFRESPEKIDSIAVGLMLSVSGYRGIEVKEYDDENRRRSGDDLVGYRIVRVGQLVVNTMWLNYAGLGVSAYEGHVSPAYRCYEIAESLERRFTHYLLRSEVYVCGYTRLLTGIRPNSLQMSRDDLMEFPILLPPRPEQISIAEFLDRETAKIDALVAEQQRLIELLKEKRQAVIAHAVTKGLNPNAPMKDSGIAWLGEVPAHWSLPPLYLRYEQALGKMLDQAKITGQHPMPYLRNIDVRWDFINVEDLPVMDIAPHERARFTVANGDLLMVEGRELGRCAIWSGEDGTVVFQKALHRLRPRANTEHTRFFYYTMIFANRVGVFFMDVSPNEIPHLTGEELRRYRFPKPPVDEQRQIARFLDDEDRRYEAFTAEATRAIDLLQERRTALISAAVTGQIDVRPRAQKT